VVIGISGGIDSAVAAALAVKSLEAKRVLGVFMPASESSPDEADARLLAEFLGIELLTVPLEKPLKALMAAPNITDTPLSAGNASARLRMTVLYNIAAARHYLVCGTSNKTEYLIGYSTKWGDGAADIQPLLHLYKKDVYAIAKELELPEILITKAPSAGFFAGQTDEKEIGMTYEELDAALFSLELNEGVPQNSIEERVVDLIQKSAHKRNPPKNRFKW
ncbi:MAG: NAD(+) synthase, partial [Methanocorpusculum sp.]|nr:NAD(+) synthase [Methanocorpusculum sp.]